MYTQYHGWILKTLCWVKATRNKNNMYVIHFIWNTRKPKLTSGDRKHYQWLHEPKGGGRNLLQREMSQFLGLIWGWSKFLSWLWLHGYIPLSKLIDLYTLNVCSLFCVNYTSIKLTLKNPYYQLCLATQHFSFGWMQYPPT